jgi:hypothetical protein
VSLQWKLWFFKIRRWAYRLWWQLDSGSLMLFQRMARLFLIYQNGTATTQILPNGYQWSQLQLRQARYFAPQRCSSTSHFQAAFLPKEQLQTFLSYLSMRLIPCRLVPTFSLSSPAYLLLLVRSQSKDSPSIRKPSAPSRSTHHRIPTQYRLLLPFRFKALLKVSRSPRFQHQSIFKAP